jgi:hypothetical protein
MRTESPDSGIPDPASLRLAAGTAIVADDHPAVLDAVASYSQSGEPEALRERLIS